MRLLMTAANPPSEGSQSGRFVAGIVKRCARAVLSRLYQVKVTGDAHYLAAGQRVLIIANHTSYLDPLLLWAFLPDDVTFAINTRIAEHWWVKPALSFVRTFPMDPTSPMSTKALTRYLQGDRKAVIFPEGRITVTGALMKIYDGAGLIAEKSGAVILPVRIDGAQYTPFSRLQGVVRLRWFPRISLNFLPPRRLSGAASGLKGNLRSRRRTGTIYNPPGCGGPL
jgi:acyl-[acyl-carrier-protein]-phospholipid O-acyltransferase/long-chain-fatty-acid--[acyl-carrier-protein] ligase